MSKVLTVCRQMPMSKKGITPQWESQREKKKKKKKKKKKNEKNTGLLIFHADALYKLSWF